MASDVNQNKNTVHTFAPTPYWRRINGDSTSDDGDRLTWLRSRIQKLRDENRCMRCTERDHQASNCRNGVICLICNKLGHKAQRCRAVTTLPPFLLRKKTIAHTSKPEAITLNDPHNISEATMHGPGPEFHHSPAIDALEQAFQRSIILYDDEHWGKDRVKQALHRLIPRFDWKVRNMPDSDWKYIIESPNAPWLNSVLTAGKVRLENKDLTVQPWDPAMDEGLRLISVWIKIWGYPMKLWHFNDLQELCKVFKGTVLELDESTAQHLDFRCARIRVGVCDVHHIPSGTWITYVTPLGFIERHDVAFEVEEHSYRVPRGTGPAPPPPPGRYGRDNHRGGSSTGDKNWHTGHAGNAGNDSSKATPPGSNTHNTMQIDGIHNSSDSRTKDKGKGIAMHCSTPSQNHSLNTTSVDKNFSVPPIASCYSMDTYQRDASTASCSKLPKPGTIDAIWHHMAQEQQSFSWGQVKTVETQTDKVTEIAVDVNTTIDDMLIQIENERRIHLQEEVMEPDNTPVKQNTVTVGQQSASPSTQTHHTIKTIVDGTATPQKLSTLDDNPVLHTPSLPIQTMVTLKTIQQYNPRRSIRLKVQGIQQTVMSKAKSRAKKRGRNTQVKEGTSLLQLFPFDRATDQDIIDIFNVNRI